jgi:hypothetical protein
METGSTAASIGLKQRMKDTIYIVLMARGSILKPTRKGAKEKP